MNDILGWVFGILIILTIQFLALVLEIVDLKDMINDLVFKLVHKQILSQCSNGWIPISEGLPENGDNVLVTICKRGRKPYVMSAEYYGEFFRNEEICEYAKSKECIVKAWMLPEPYKT